MGERWRFLRRPLTTVGGGVLVAAILMGGCGADSGGEPAAPTENAPTPTAPAPIAPGQPPGGLVLLSAERGEPRQPEVDVIGRRDVDDPFAHGIARFGTDPEATPITVPGGTTVDLGTVSGRLFGEVPGDLLTDVVLWIDHRGKHSLAGYGLESDTLVELATALASPTGELPDGWVVLVEPQELAGDGGRLTYVEGGLPGDGRWVDLELREGGEAVHGFLWTVEVAGTCDALAAARCGEQVEVRGATGWLHTWTDDTSRELAVLSWVDPTGWVVIMRAGNVEVDELMGMAGSLETTTWDALAAASTAGPNPASDDPPDTTVP